MGLSSSRSVVGIGLRQRFRVGNSAEATGHINPKYGSAPGRLIYTHVSVPGVGP